MPSLSRRKLLGTSFAMTVVEQTRPSLSQPASHAKDFIDEAFRMRDVAVASGDQAYGAVIVLNGEIIGHGPSRVIIDNNSDAHAERVALWDAQQRLGRKDLAGAVIYSTSRPCAICQAALADANIARMYVGQSAADAGPPQQSR